MLRIGIAASKMSKGSLLRYNLYVILISSLISLFIFFICGFSILLIVYLTSLILHAIRPTDFHAGWAHMFKICLIILALVVACLNIVAIIKNIQLPKKRI